MSESIEGGQRQCFCPDVGELIVSGYRTKLHHLIITALLEVAHLDGDVLLLFRELLVEDNEL